MEGPIQPIPPVPIDRVVPHLRSRGERRGKHDEARHERPFEVPEEGPAPAPAEDAAPPAHSPPTAHEDGVGERLDVTA